MRALTIPDPKLRTRRRQLRRGDHRGIGPRAADRGYRQGGARLRGPPDRARHRTLARGQRAPQPCAVPRSRENAGQGQMAEHRARHRRRPDRVVGGVVRGAADRPSAGVDRRPRSARWPEARRTPRFPPPMSATRSAISRGPPKCSVAPWSRPTRRARRRCARLAEQRLAEESYRKLFEGSVDGIYVTTPGGALLNANPALARMMGYDTPQRSDGRHRRHRRSDLCPSAGARRISEADAARRHGSRVRISGSRPRRQGALALRQRDRRPRRYRRGRAL